MIPLSIVKMAKNTQRVTGTISLSVITQYNMWFLLIAINAVSSYVSVNTQYQYLQNLRANHVAY